jgi:DNA topoisomerase-1
MPGLSAKVFRTYNASWTFQEQLKNTPEDGTVAEKIAAYNTANRMVAILCNHQKTVSKTFDESFAKMGDKVGLPFFSNTMKFADGQIRALKYQRMKLRLQLFTLDPKAKKRNPELAEDESDLDEEFMERHEADLLEKALEGAKKKFDKDNIKLEDQQEAKLPKSELDDKLKAIKAEFKELRKERKSKEVEPRKGGKLLCCCGGTAW